VTLLLANALAMESLPIFLDAIVPSFWAIIISVTAVLFFGEVIPQAICTGPSQLKIACFLSPFVVFMMYFFAVVGYPISKLLDIILGEHDITRFKNDQLKTLVQMHSQSALNEIKYQMTADVGLSNMQTKIIAGAFDLRNSTIGSLTTSFERVFSLSTDTVMDMDTITIISAKGYSRIPIYYGQNYTFIIGVLIVKSLIGIDLQAKKTLIQHMREGTCVVKAPIYANP
jgi:metal transporter CNNM